MCHEFRAGDRALHLALLTGRPDGWRPRPGAEPAADRPDWLEGSFRFDADESALRELLAIGPDVEVLLPIELRHEVAAAARRIVELHGVDVDA